MMADGDGAFLLAWSFLFLPALLMGAAFTIATVFWLLVFVPLLLVWFWLLARICRKAGFSGWWALTSLFPPVFAIMIWVFAFADWPTAPPRRF